MQFPLVKLSDIETGGDYRYAEFPDAPEKGSFLEIHRSNTSTVIRVDRFSTIPFYHALWNDRLYAATTLWGLLEELPPDYLKRLDRVAALQFLRTNCMMGERTLLEGITRVPWGSELFWSEGRLRIDRYWRLPAEVDEDLTESEALGRLHEAMQTAIAEECQGAASLGMHLSGGMDSRQLLGALLEHGKPFLGFTYGMPDNLDLEIARDLARHLDLPLYVETWPPETFFLRDAGEHFHLTDGMQALFHGHGIHIHRKQQECVSRVFHGHMLDLFLQAHQYDPRFEKAKTDRSVREALYDSFNGGPCSVMRADDIEVAMVAPDLEGAFRASVMQDLAELDYLRPEKQYDAAYLLHHGLRRLLPQVQSGARFVDYRVPGLHQALFETSWKIPGSLRKHRGLQMQLLKQYYPQTVARIPLIKDNVQLVYAGDRFADKLRWGVSERLRAKGILPAGGDYYAGGLERLIRGPLWERLRRRVTDAALMEADVLKPDYILETVRSVETGERCLAGHLGAMFTLSTFIKKIL